MGLFDFFKKKQKEEIKTLDKIEKIEKKLITERIILERIARRYDYPESWIYDTDFIEGLPADYYGFLLGGDCSKPFDYWIDEKTTADGQLVYIATEDLENIPADNIHQSDEHFRWYLAEAIKAGFKNIYVDSYDLEWVHEAKEDVFDDLVKKLTANVVDELKKEGYEE